MKGIDDTFLGNYVDNKISCFDIDGSRIQTDDKLDGGATNSDNAIVKLQGFDRPWMHDSVKLKAHQKKLRENVRKSESLGRYPANIIHDGSMDVLKNFPSKAGGEDNRGKCQGSRSGGFGNVGHDKGDNEPNAMVYDDSGSAARFFKNITNQNENTPD